MTQANSLNPECLPDTMVQTRAKQACIQIQRPLSPESTLNPPSLLNKPLEDGMLTTSGLIVNLTSFLATLKIRLFTKMKHIDLIGLMDVSSNTNKYLFILNKQGNQYFLTALNPVYKQEQLEMYLYNVSVDIMGQWRRVVLFLGGAEN